MKLKMPRKTAVVAILGKQTVEDRRENTLELGSGWMALDLDAAAGNPTPYLPARGQGLLNPRTGFPVTSLQPYDDPPSARSPEKREESSRPIHVLTR